MPIPRKRLPRYQRASGELRPFRLTTRDLGLVRQVARHRFLSSRQITSLMKGAPAQILRRLQFLYHAGYLDRPRCQIDYFHRGGSRPIVYCLGSRGAALMRREDDLPFNRMVWSRPGHPVGRVFLEHALMISEILVSLEKDCAESGGAVHFFSFEELDAGHPGLKRRTEPFRWNATVGGRRIGLVPDAVFILEYRDAGPGCERVVCFLEADRGTMPITRRNPGLSCFTRKLEAYAALWKQGEFAGRFKTRRVAVHAVTTSEARAANLRQAVAGLPQGQGLFAVHAFLDSEKVTKEIIAHAAPATKW